MYPGSMERTGMTIRFLRNKVVEVEPLSDGSLAVSWRLTDDLFKAQVNLRVQPPDLEIVEAEAKLERFVPKEWLSAPELVKKAEGVRVGSGLRKIVSGLLGGPKGCSLLVHAVLEASNAVILRGGKEAVHSNAAIADVLIEGGCKKGLPEHAVQLVRTTDRAAVRDLCRMVGRVDLVIPRGGEALIRAVSEQAWVPVIKHYTGNCHVYVHGAADLDMAEKIVVNAKCQRPGICNAAETLLVDAAVAEEFVPRIAGALADAGVELRGCDRSRKLAKMTAADEDDWYVPGSLDSAYFECKWAMEMEAHRAVVDGLAAAAFFLRGGEHVPHMILGRPDRDVLTVLDGGARTQLNCGDPGLLRKLTRLIPGEPGS